MSVNGSWVAARHINVWDTGYHKTPQSYSVQHKNDKNLYYKKAISIFLNFSFFFFSILSCSLIAMLWKQPSISCLKNLVCCCNVCKKSIWSLFFSKPIFRAPIERRMKKKWSGRDCINSHNSGNSLSSKHYRFIALELMKRSKMKPEQAQFYFCDLWRKMVETN